MSKIANKRTEVLYNGDVEIDFYPDSHRYKMAGEKTYLISATACTGIIDKSMFLIPWAVRLVGSFITEYLERSKENRFTKEELRPVIEEALIQHTVKKETAADIGTAIHNWCEQFAKAQMNGTEFPEIPEEIEGMKPEDVGKVHNGINGFLDWFNSRDVKFEHSERLIYSRIHGFVGITDFIARINGFRVLGDFKSSKGVYDEQFFQLAGYMGAVEEEEEYSNENAEKFENGLILHFDKETGAFGHYEMSREEYEKNYETFLHAYGIKKRLKELAAKKGYSRE
jgi:hypothetical protein